MINDASDGTRSGAWSGPGSGEASGPSAPSPTAWVASLSTIVSSLFDLDRLCAALASLVADTVPCEHIFVHVRDPRSGELDLVVSSGPHTHEAAERIAAGIATRAIETRRIQCIRSPHDPDGTGDDPEPAADAAPIAEGSAGPLLACALYDEREVLGAITVLLRAVDAPADAWIRPLGAAGALAATALAVARTCDARLARQEALEDQLRRRTAEAEEARTALVRQEQVATMGKLAASIAHEVNNPMSFVLSNLHQAAKTVHELNAALPGLVDVVRSVSAIGPPGESDAERVERLRALGERTTDERTSARIVSGAVDLEELLAESLEGAERIRRVSEDMRRFAHGLGGVMDEAEADSIVETALHVVDEGRHAGIRIERHLEPLPRIRCQRHQIAQVLLNLLQNAIEAVGEAGSVEVRTRAVEGWVEVEVDDDGPGIPPERRERVFEPFYTTRDQGTGLGLAISRDIVRSHRGTLEVVDVPAGACLRLRLPASGR